VTGGSSTGTRQRGFYRLWIGQSASVLLSGATSIALSLWIFEVTGSATHLALVISIRMASSIYLSPLAGVIADQVSRKRLVTGANIVLASLALLFAVITSGSSPSLPLVYALLVGTGVVDSVLLVTLAASLRDLREESDLTRAAGLVALLDRSPAVVAPALGATLYAFVGLNFVLLLDAVSFTAAGILAATVAGWRGGTRPHGASMWRNVVETSSDGIKAIWANGRFRRLQLFNSALNAVNGLAIAGVSAFLINSALGGETALGVFNSATALGLVVASALLASVGPRVRRRTYVIGGLGLAALGGRVLLGLASQPWLWVGAGFLRGVGLQTSNIALTALWVEATPPSSQGRVFGARRLLGQGAYPVAVLAGGAVVDAISATAVPPWIMMLGALELLTVGALYVSGVLDGSDVSSGPSLVVETTRS
jgi:MFS transporter, DHA3 family, macrolide efflux protein